MLYGRRRDRVPGHAEAIASSESFEVCGDNVLSPSHVPLVAGLDPEGKSVCGGAERAATRPPLFGRRVRVAVGKVVGHHRGAVHGAKDLDHLLSEAGLEDPDVLLLQPPKEVRGLPAAHL